MHHPLLDFRGFVALTPLAGRRARIGGTLSSAITGHHHAPVLITVRSAAPAP